MAPGSPSQRKARETNFTDIGVAGRKTGFMVKDTGQRNAFGMEHMDAFFSPDPPAPPPNMHPGEKGKANGGGSRSEGEGVTGMTGDKTISSGTMDIVTSSAPQPPSSSASSVRRLTSLPPRARSPRRTNLGTPARRASSVGFSSPDKPSPLRPANRKLDFGNSGTAGDKEASPRLLNQPAKRVSMSPARKEVHRAPSSSSSAAVKEPEKKKEPEVARAKPKTKQKQAMPKVVEETVIQDSQLTPPVAAVKKKRGLLMQGKKSGLVAEGGKKKAFSLQDDEDTEDDDENGDVEMSDGGIDNGLDSAVNLGGQEERHPIEEEVSQILGDEDTVMTDGEEEDVQVAPVKKGKGKAKEVAKQKAAAPLPGKKAKSIPPAKKTQARAEVGGKADGKTQSQDGESEESESGEEAVKPAKAKAAPRGKGRALATASQPETVQPSKAKASAKAKEKARPQVEEVSSDSEPEVQAPKPRAAPRGRSRAKAHAQEPEPEPEPGEVQAPKSKAAANGKAKASAKVAQAQQDGSEVEEVIPAPKSKAAAKGKGKGKTNSTAKDTEGSVASSSSAKANSRAKGKSRARATTPPSEDEADEQSEGEDDPAPPPPPKPRAASRAKGKAKTKPVGEPEAEAEPVSSSQKSKAKPTARTRGAVKSRSEPEHEIPESSPALAPIETIDEEAGEEEDDDEAAQPARKKVRQSPRTTRPAATSASKGKGKAVAAGAKKPTAQASRRRDISPELATATAATNAKQSTSSSSQTAAPRPRGQRVIHERPTAEPDSIPNGRPTRHRIKPLDFWKGEKVVYTLTDPSTTAAASSIKLPEIAEIIRVESDEEEKARDRERRKKRAAAAQSAGNKRKRALKQEDAEDEEFEEEPWESQIVDGEVGVIRGYVKPFPPSSAPEQLEEMELAFSRNRIVTVEVANGDFTFVKTCTQPFFGTGMIEIPPGGIKRTKNSGKMHLVFYLLKGKVQVHVGETMFRVRNGGQFMVPRGNLYSIENPYDVQAKMFFAQGCEVEVQEEEDE